MITTLTFASWSWGIHQADVTKPGQNLSLFGPNEVLNDSMHAAMSENVTESLACRPMTDRMHAALSLYDNCCVLGPIGSVECRVTTVRSHSTKMKATTIQFSSGLDMPLN